MITTRTLRRASLLAMFSLFIGCTSHESPVPPQGGAAHPAAAPHAAADVAVATDERGSGSMPAPVADGRLAEEATEEAADDRDEELAIEPNGDEDDKVEAVVSADPDIAIEDDSTEALESGVDDPERIDDEAFDPAEHEITDDGR